MRALGRSVCWDTKSTSLFFLLFSLPGHGDGMDARDDRGTPGACRGENNCMGLWNILGCETGFIQHGGRRLGVRRRDELSYAGTF